MSIRILRIGTREALNHPQGTLRMSAAAIRYRKAILAAMATARQASRYGTTVKESAANPKVRAEARMALLSLALAGQRARKVGIAAASRDKQVAAQLLRAQRHAAKAVSTAKRPKGRHRIIRTSVVVAGAGAAGGAAYASWKTRPQPRPPTADPPAQADATGSALAGSTP
jgi:hypothetical protein